MCPLILPMRHHRKLRREKIMKTYCWQMYKRPYNDVKALLPHPFFLGLFFFRLSMRSSYLIGLSAKLMKNSSHLICCGTSGKTWKIDGIKACFGEAFASLIAWHRIKQRSRFAHKVSHYLLRELRQKVFSIKRVWEQKSFLFQ